MPRRPRDQTAPGIHHVFARGLDRAPIFGEDRWRSLLLALLEPVVLRHAWNCLAYCILGNHYHLLVETVKPNLSRGMQLLNGGFAIRYNELTGRVGHVFAGRFGSVRVETHAQLLRTLRYVLANATSSGFAAAPEDWPWSSLPATIGNVPGPPLLALARLAELLYVDECDLDALVADLVYDVPAFERSA